MAGFGESLEDELRAEVEAPRVEQAKDRSKGVSITPFDDAIDEVATLVGVPIYPSALLQMQKVAEKLRGMQIDPTEEKIGNEPADVTAEQAAEVVKAALAWRNGIASDSLLTEKDWTLLKAVDSYGRQYKGMRARS